MSMSASRNAFPAIFSEHLKKEKVVFVSVGWLSNAREEERSDGSVRAKSREFHRKK